MRDAEKTLPSDPFDDKHAHPRRSSSDDDITALPRSKRLSQSPHLRHVTNDHGIPYNFHQSTHSHSSVALAKERGKLQRPQSLRKPTPQDSGIIRRISSKKRREHDQLREEEIRAMSMPMPQKRPAGNSGGMLRRDSKKVKGGLNRHFDRPTSNISLPLEESIHSSMSGNSENRSWRVSALDMFSPRPTVRCSVGSQYYYSGARTSPTSYNEKTDARREKRTLLPHDDKVRDKRTSRIDDLADTLDAGALREILERDKRRREKKRKADDERLRRRLERRAESQRNGEQGGTPASPRREARGTVGLGIEKETYTPMEDIQPSQPSKPVPMPTMTPAPPPQLDSAPLTAKHEENSQLPTPLPTPLATPIEEAVVSDAQAVRYSRASMSPSPQGHVRGPSNVSEMPALLSEMQQRETSPELSHQHQDPTASGSLHAVQTAETAATSMQGSTRRRSSEGRRMGVFASFFRRTKRNSQDQGRTTPSEISFSNTSRESMSRQPLPAHLVAPPPTQPIQIRRPSSNVPHRTMSKFREDLPEYPISPPDSRVQSPEVPTTSAIAARRRSQPPSELRLNSNSPGPSGRTDSPVSPSVPAATGLMSQSLASVDSEGSWLSGKPMQRRSNKSHLRSSVGSATGVLRRNEEFNASYEELGIPDDEYFKRLTPQPDELRRPSVDLLMNRKASSTVMAPIDIAGDLEEEEAPSADSPSSEEEQVKSGIGRQPTIVHRQPRVKSTEGLLSFYQDEKPLQEDEKVSFTGPRDSTEQSSPASEGEPMLVQRAKSVDLGKHHSRQLSAGSAKLLDIPARRSSVDPKRTSLGSQSAMQQQ